MTQSSHLRPDGTTFPPVTPDPPYPPGSDLAEIVDAIGTPLADVEDEATGENHGATREGTNEGATESASHEPTD